MSTIRTEVCVLENVRQHPNADNLDLATVKGWQIATNKTTGHKSGDLVVYFENGTVMPQALAERLNVVNYLSNKTDINGDKVLVVGRIRLRGEPSFGLIIPVSEAAEDYEELVPGDDVSEHFGVSKFFPPVKVTAGDADVDHHMFPKYTDIENMRSFPSVFVEGEAVEASEKVHGTNSRVGFVVEEGSAEPQPIYMAGSRTLRRKRPADENMASNTYWGPLMKPTVSNLFTHLYNLGHKQAILFGEVFGKGIQSYDYGTNRPDFRAFDLMLDGKYVDREVFYGLCRMFKVETCPVLYEGSYSLEAIKAISDGDSVVGGSRNREGVVVRPLVERSHPQVGRVILKYIGDSFLFGKGGQEDTTDQ